jgi:hypothetical protein
MVITIHRYFVTVKEDLGDTLHLSCTCGTDFTSDAFGENVLWVSGVSADGTETGGNVPQCPNCQTTLE